MNVKIIDMTGKFIIYDKRGTLFISEDMAHAEKIAELARLYFTLEYWQRREVAVYAGDGFGLLRYLDGVDRMDRKRRRAARHTK